MSLLPAGCPAHTQKQPEEEAAVLAGSHVSPGRNRQGAGGRGGGQRGAEEEEGEEEEDRHKAGNGVRKVKKKRKHCTTRKPQREEKSDINFEATVVILLRGFQSDSGVSEGGPGSQV